MITLKNVSKTYELKKQQVQAVQDVSVTINRGEFVVITGRSGSGKTTLLNLVAGLTRPTGGQVLFDNVEVWKLSDEEQAHLRNKKLGFVFQFPSLMPSLSVLENVLLPTGFNAASHGHENAARARAVELLNLVGLSDKLEAYPRQLSAGQQQRVVIARALINSPELILADEPTSDLDEQTEHEVMALFQSIHKQTGITILLVTHASELISYGSGSIRMANGSIVAG
jgi:putative ABC transport system ATP-binding protein/lipoprotein-releasing system ATP-binding protein